MLCVVLSTYVLVFTWVWGLTYSCEEYLEDTVTPRESNNGSGGGLGRYDGSRYSDPSQDFRKGAIWESFLEELEGKEGRDGR